MIAERIAVLSSEFLHFLTFYVGFSTALINGQNLEQPDASSTEKQSSDSASSETTEMPSKGGSNSESIGSNLKDLASKSSKDTRPNSEMMDGFSFSLKPTSGRVKPISQIKKQKKENTRPRSKTEELPSLDDLKALHDFKRNRDAKKQKAQAVASVQNRTLKIAQSEKKKGEVGILGDEHFVASNSSQSQIGDLGSLGASTTLPHPTKASQGNDAAWKRKLQNMGIAESPDKPADPEVPSASDLGEIATFKKELAAAVKGMGPSTLMMKKSRVPKPHRQYWGIDVVGDNNEHEKDDISSAISNRRRYWGINAADGVSEPKNGIPGNPGMFYSCLCFFLLDICFAYAR